MAFPLATVLAAAPGIISAATDIIRVIKQRKQEAPPAQAAPDAEALEALVALLEKQAVVIEELAVNNQQLTLAVRNNRIISILALLLALLAAGLAI